MKVLPLSDSVDFVLLSRSHTHTTGLTSDCFSQRRRRTRPQSLYTFMSEDVDMKGNGTEHPCMAHTKIEGVLGLPDHFCSRRLYPPPPCAGHRQLKVLQWPLQHDGQRKPVEVHDE